MAVQETAANSVLNFVRKMVKLRKENKEVFVYGKYTLLDKENKDVFAYTREASGKKFLVMLNFSKNKTTANIGLDISKAKLLINNYELATGATMLRPYEAAIYQL